MTTGKGDRETKRKGAGEVEKTAPFLHFSKNFAILEKGKGEVSEI